MSDCPALPDRDPWIQGESVYEPAVLFRGHPEHIFLRHRPLELAVPIMDPVVDQGKSIPFKHERFKTVALPATEKKDGMLIVGVQVKLTLNNGGKFFDPLAHIRIVRQDPDICVM